MRRINLFALTAVFFFTVWSANAQTPATPGGINNPNYTWLAWLTPDSYNNGIWTNLIREQGSVGDFTSNSTPPKINSGYNFHPSLNFPNSNTYWIRSAKSSGITASDNVTAIFVLKRSTQIDSYNYLLALNDVSDGTHGYGVAWRNSNTNISWRWNGAAYEFTGIPVTEGIVALDNANNGSSAGLTLYLNGSRRKDITATAPNVIDQPVAIASAENDRSLWAYEGTLQEVILLKANGTGRRIEPSDLQKIHSYLAVKYGITMAGSNYVSSGGADVWDMTAGSGYNSNIFGIARDDGYGLYQKQSHSVAFSLLTAFAGEDIAALNSNNISGKLDNGVYAMFGGNGGSFSTTVSLASEIPIPGSGLSANYRKELMYMAQLTGASPQKIKLKIAADMGTLPEYVLVSANSTFPPASTKVFHIAGSVAEVEIPVGSSYIAFGGHTTGSGEGPGGVNSGLKLWLRADDAASITTELLPLTDAKVASYPDANTGNVLAVLEWRDPAHGHTYSYAAGGNTRHLKPVYQPGNYMTNYHPTVRFWSYGTGSATSNAGNAAWLGNSSGVWKDKFPANNRHSAFFVVNNDFSTNDWVYTMMFADPDPNNYKGPGYGVQQVGGGAVGRFRTNDKASNTHCLGKLDLFTPGATSILGYHIANRGQKKDDKIDVLWRFNGMEDWLDSGEIENEDFGLNQPSTIGTGYRRNRTIQGVMSEIIMYDGALSADDLQLVESYLALKYGVTLTPVTSGGRFDYIFSNGVKLWNGTATGSIWDTWYHGIAAVIRDDASDLNNRQSHSTNVGSILHMGVAGTRLGTNANPGNFENDMEAVIWGDNNATGVETLAVDPDDPDRCGDFTEIFKRNWLVHKRTKGNRPVSMIVGAQNNAGNQLGKNSSSDEQDLYSKLSEGYSVYMIVADSVEKITPGNPKYGQFTAIAPMQFLDGEQQCIYTFSDSITYITFGCTKKTAGCTETVKFEGTKTFYWTQWTRQNYGNSVHGSGVTKNTAVDLGDNIQVVSTNVVYGNGVNAPAYYPSVTNSPATGSLYLRRRNGALADSKVTLTVNLNTPVRPEFSIYDIDGYSGRLEQVTVTGYCNGGGVLPTLSHAGNPASSYYRISGNRATATVRSDLSPSNRNGQLNVSFAEGVKQIVIEFAITGKPQVSTTHNLIVSPIRLRQVPPPPPVNLDGLTFVKDVAKRDITTCEPAEYSFYIGNTNCSPKFVSFRDTLPPGLKWEYGVGTGALKPVDDSHLKFNSYEGTSILAIDSLYVPGSDILRVTATAMIDKGYVPVGDVRSFDNHAWIEYLHVKDGSAYARKLLSLDRETLDSETRFNATGAQRLDSVTVTASANMQNYSADTTVTVTLTVVNPNSAIPNSLLDVDFDAGFTYVANSFASTGISSPTPVIILGGDGKPLGNGSLCIAGDTGGNQGFNIPNGKSTFTFKLKAPSLAGLVMEFDESGGTTQDISPLKFEYMLASETNNPCILLGMANASGMLEIPYRILMANDDRISTVTGNAVAVPIQANDSIPLNCSMLMEIIVPPKHGSAAVSASGDSILYTPYSGYTGRDTLAYRLSCGIDTDSAYLYIYVAEKLLNDTLSMLYNSDTVIHVKGNDLIPVCCSATAPTITDDPANGVATIVADSIGYTPNNGFYGIDSLVYRLTCTLCDTASAPEAKVYIIVSKPAYPAPYIGCAGSPVNTGFEHIDGIEYYWYTTETGGSPSADSPVDAPARTAPSDWWVEARYKGQAVKPRFKISVEVLPALKAGSISADQTICYGVAPAKLVSSESASGSSVTIACQWQDSTDMHDWTNIAGATDKDYLPPASLDRTTKYRRSATDSCGTAYTAPVTITVHPKSLLNYPDIRIRLCPDTGQIVNLSKYLDTLALTSVKWESVAPQVPIINAEAGTVSTSNLKVSSLYTFTYTVSNPCVKDIKRKVYVETLKHGKMRPLHDTVEICYLHAEALQINWLFGIEARGSWHFSSSVGNIMQYVTQSTSQIHNGAVVMDGKAVYESFSGTYTYRGSSAEWVKIEYTSAADSCLAGKKYTVVIILTPDII